MDARSLALLLTLALLPAASAADVAAGDSDLDAPLAVVAAPLSFMDADGDGQPDAASPDEPAYLDMDKSASVSFGDLRLTAFGPYPAGTLVDVANRDVGRPLSRSAGWLAKAGGEWIADMDNSGSVSVGDVRLAAAGDAKVRAGDAALGAPLALPAMAVEQRGQLDHVDGDQDGHWAVGAPLFLDADGDRAVSRGDLRLASTGFGLEVGPSPAEVEAALQVLAAAEAARVAAEADAAADSGWAAWQVLTLVAAVAALAVVALVVVRSRRAAGPRDPFTTAPVGPGRFK